MKVKQIAYFLAVNQSNLKFRWLKFYMFKLKRFNQVQEGLSSQDFASGEFIMRYKRLIPADYLQIRSGQRINLFMMNSIQNLN